jgi:phosphoserine aminotransferase
MEETARVRFRCRASGTIKEAKCFGGTVLLASSKIKTIIMFPQGYTVPADADYFHCTTEHYFWNTNERISIC